MVHDTYERTYPTVLFVDDSRGVLWSIGRVVKSLQICPLFSQDPVEALGMAALLAPRLVISDFNMKTMDGLTFLREVRVLSPRSKCVLYTAELDARRLMDSDVLLLMKPCPIEPFRQFIVDQLKEEIR